MLICLWLVGFYTHGKMVITEACNKPESYNSCSGVVLLLSSYTHFILLLSDWTGEFRTLIVAEVITSSERVKNHFVGLVAQKVGFLLKP